MVRFSKFGKRRRKNRVESISKLKTERIYIRKGQVQRGRRRREVTRSVYSKKSKEKNEHCKIRVGGKERIYEGGERVREIKR